MSPADAPALNRSREVPAVTQSGYVMLLVSLVLVAVAGWLFITAVSGEGPPEGLALIARWCSALSACSSSPAST